MSIIRNDTDSRVSQHPVVTNFREIDIPVPAPLANGRGLVANSGSLFHCTATVLYWLLFHCTATVPVPVPVHIPGDTLRGYHSGAYPVEVTTVYGIGAVTSATSSYRNNAETSVDDLADLSKIRPR